MSPALSDVPRKVLRALESIGFVHRRTSGSHAVLRHPDGRVAIVPQHGTVTDNPGHPALQVMRYEL